MGLFNLEIYQAGSKSQLNIRYALALDTGHQGIFWVVDPWAVRAIPTYSGISKERFGNFLILGVLLLNYERLVS